MYLTRTKHGDLRRQFDSKVPALRQLRDEALFILEQALQKSGIKYHSLTSRIKTFESFRAKAERKKLKTPMEQVRDLVGLRIVCLFLSDIERAAKIVRNSFKVVEEDNKIDGQQITSFGYMSFHFTVQMKDTYSGPRYDSIAKMPIEIQVRTIAMDAWAAASHYLDYKTEADIPSDLRRDFYALSGLFYVADRHFEMFFNSRQTVREQIEETLERAHPAFDQELNLDSLSSYLRTKFPKREQPDPPFVSELLQELRAAGYNNVQRVDDTVRKHWKWFTASEKANPPVDPESPEKKRTRFTATGVIRFILNQRILTPDERKKA
jgi:putative GTP pyrophosphokinase